MAEPGVAAVDAASGSSGPVVEDAVADDAVAPVEAIASPRLPTHKNGGLAHEDMPMGWSTPEEITEHQHHHGRVEAPAHRPWPAAVPLRGVVQHYAWGKPWDTSLVAAMATEQVRSRRGPQRAPPLNRGQRWAELWMGSHPNGPSSVVLPGDDGDAGPDEEWYLKDAIELDPEFWLGEDAHRNDIPFLFKVLSVRQALSVQAHPNKSLAEQLHRKSPANYPDANHKPEICIPLGYFEALCGFRPVDEVRRHVAEVPELRRLCRAAGEPEKAPLRELFSGLMVADSFLVQRQVMALVERLGKQETRTLEEDLILRIVKDFPGDVGVFCVYFLNYVRINPEEGFRCIYCAPDEPHAYLLGDAVECMAISDNVVRAGLTSKQKDVQTLLQMLTYRDDLLDQLVMPAEEVAPNVIKYNPPVEDFCVYEILGPVPEGLWLQHAAITACVSGTFSIEFRTRRGPQRGRFCPSTGQRLSTATDAARAAGKVRSITPVPKGRGPQRVTMGNTFFSRAGTCLLVHSVEGVGRLFIATY